MAIVKTMCACDCPDSCFMEVSVEDGRIVSVQADRTAAYTQGFLCPRGMADPKRVYSDRRVLGPRRRTAAKPDGATTLRRLAAEIEEQRLVIGRSAEEAQALVGPRRRPHLFEDPVTGALRLEGEGFPIPLEPGLFEILVHEVGNIRFGLTPFGNPPGLRISPDRRVIR